MEYKTFKLNGHCYLKRAAKNKTSNLNFIMENNIIHKVKRKINYQYIKKENIGKQSKINIFGDTGLENKMADLRHIKIW